VQLKKTVVIEPLELNSHSLARLAFAAQDLSAQLDGGLSVGEMDHDIELMLLGKLLRIDLQKHPATTDVGTRRLDDFMIQLQIDRQFRVHSAKDSLLDVIHDALDQAFTHYTALRLAWRQQPCLLLFQVAAASGALTKTPRKLALVRFRRH